MKILDSLDRRRAGGLRGLFLPLVRSSRAAPASGGQAQDPGHQDCGNATHERNA
jgi:hypothetical protein